MLKNDYLVAKIGVDTAENTHRKEWCVVAMDPSKPEKARLHVAISVGEGPFTMGEAINLQSRALKDEHGNVSRVARRVTRSFSNAEEHDS